MKRNAAAFAIYLLLLLGIFAAFAFIVSGCINTGATPATRPTAQPLNLITPMAAGQKSRLVRLPPRLRPTRTQIAAEARNVRALKFANGAFQIVPEGDHIDPAPKWYSRRPDGSFEEHISPPSPKAAPATAPGTVGDAGFTWTVRYASPPFPTDGGTPRDTINNLLFTWGDDNMRANEIAQDGIGDCWLLATLMDHAVNHPEIRPNFIHRNATGGYDVVFIYQKGFFSGSKLVVKTDGRIGDVSFVHRVTGSNFGAIFEKATAFARRNMMSPNDVSNLYSSLNGGSVAEPLMWTGCTWHYLQSTYPDFVTLVRANIAAGKGVLVHTYTGAQFLVGWHAYSVYACRLVPGPTIAEFDMMNPWGGGVDQGCVTITLAQYIASVSATFAVDTYPDPVPAIAGDFNLDGIVGLSDYNIWFDNNGTSTAAMSSLDKILHGDFNGSGYVDLTDYNAWFSKLGTAQVD